MDIPVTVLVFVLFFVGAFVTVLLDSDWARRAFVAIFLLLVLFPGFSGRGAWPFITWHLFGEVRSTSLNYYQVRLVDVAGKEIQFDARAVPPALQTPIRRYGSMMAEKPDDPDMKELGCFLLDRAVEYQRARWEGELSFWRYVKFPRHQYGFEWNEVIDTTVAKINAIRVYEMRLELTPDARNVVHLLPEERVEYRREECGASDS